MLWPTTSRPIPRVSNYLSLPSLQGTCRLQWQLPVSQWKHWLKDWSLSLNTATHRGTGRPLCIQLRPLQYYYIIHCIREALAGHWAQQPSSLRKTALTPAGADLCKQLLSSQARGRIGANAQWDRMFMTNIITGHGECVMVRGYINNADVMSWAMSAHSVRLKGCIRYSSNLRMRHVSDLTQSHNLHSLCARILKIFECAYVKIQVYFLLQMTEMAE